MPASERIRSMKIADEKIFHLVHASSNGDNEVSEFSCTVVFSDRIAAYATSYQGWKPQVSTDGSDSPGMSGTDVVMREEESSAVSASGSDSDDDYDVPVADNVSSHLPGPSTSKVNGIGMEIDVDSEGDESKGEETLSEGESDDDDEEGDSTTEEEGEDEEEQDTASSASGSSEELSEESDSDDESSEGEEDDVWGVGTSNERTVNNLEATEANAMMEFNEAMAARAAGKNVKAIKIFKKVLKNPLVAEHHNTDFDWEQERHPDERLPKMARLFVGVHKSLATLVENPKQHLLQVLAQAPKNPDVWYDLGNKMMEDGDLDMARFALEKSIEDDLYCCSRGYDALLSLLYLMGNYHACLQMCKNVLDSNPTSQKALFLKEKIRTINNHYGDYCDKLFVENRLYENSKKATPRYIKDASQRLKTVEERIQKINYSPVPLQQLESINVSLDENTTLITVATLFCDLFDRIEAYSSLLRQRIVFAGWPDRQIHLDTVEVVEFLSEITETVNKIVDQVSERVDTSVSGSSPGVEETSSRFFDLTACRRSTRTIERLDSRIEDGSCSPDRAESAQGNELEQYFGFCARPITPLKRRGTVAKSRTPSPGLNSPFNEEAMLSELREELLSHENGVTIFEGLVIILHLLTEHCPALGSIQLNQQEVWIQCYRRLNRLSGSLIEDDFLPVHVLFFELGEPEAQSYCHERAYSNKGWPNRELAARFAWQQSKSSKLELQRSLLEWLRDELKDDEFIHTATGGFFVDDVSRVLDKIERDQRIYSLNALREQKQYQEMLRILLEDVDLNALEDSDVIEMIDFWIEGLKELDQWDELAILVTRVINWLKTVDENEIPLRDFIISIVDLSWENVKDVDNLSALGHELFLISEDESFVHRHWWIFWKLMYLLAKTIEGPLCLETVQKAVSLSDEGDDLPTRSLAVLMKAHEILGSSRGCTQDAGAFLVFFLKEMYAVLSCPGVSDLLQESRNAWILANVTDEVAQFLACTFGKYTKRRRIVGDHGEEANLCADALDDVMESAISLALPSPLPVFDDKERLGHDVIELVQNRYPKLLEVDEERKRVVDELNNWLKSDHEGFDWPITDESKFLAYLYYTFALHHYRANNHDKCGFFASLFLTSGYATRACSVTYSAWSMLAHAKVAELFQLSDSDMMWSWRSYIRPFELAIEFNNLEGIVYFEKSHALYQLATRVSRFLNRLDDDDIHLRRGFSIVEEIREQALAGFEKALLMPKDPDVCSDSQWLCFFFSAKIAVKQGLEGNVLKALDGFYEAACSLELNSFSYPPKIAIKNQKNIEPLEVHYQAHAITWKYLQQCSNPPLDVLSSILAYLRCLQNHGVCKGGSSLFTVVPDLQTTLMGVVTKCVAQESATSDEVASTVADLCLRTDLIDEIVTLCQKGFEQCVDRFPHLKSYHRLAEMCISRGDLSTAFTHIMKGVFRRKKKEDENFIEGAIEILCSDISRSGSFHYHIARSLELAIALSYKLNDSVTLSCTACNLIELAINEDIDLLTPNDRSRLIVHSWRSFRKLASDPAKRTPSIKQDIHRLYTSLTRWKTGGRRMAANLHREAIQLITTLYGSVERLSNEVKLAQEAKKKQTRKRKLVSEDVGKASAYQNIMRNVVAKHSRPANQTVQASSSNTQTQQPPSQSVNASVGSLANHVGAAQAPSIPQDPALLMQWAMQLCSVGAITPQQLFGFGGR